MNAVQVGRAVKILLLGVQPICGNQLGSKWLGYLYFCSDSLPGHQQPLSILRDSSNFVKYVVSAALGKIHKVIEYCVCNLHVIAKHNMYVAM